MARSGDFVVALLLTSTVFLAGLVDGNGKKLNRNYASHECGAKVIAANQEAEGTSRILSESKDEYMLNPCKAKIWFVLELCEPIQPTAIELANFELFSSTPKDLSIQGSERFPTREWIDLGKFTASDQRTLQHFEIKAQPEFLKYIKIEMQSHYGTEHYCPLSLVRAFGTTLVEEFDALESGGSNKAAAIGDDQLDLESALYEDSLDRKNGPPNMFGFVRHTIIDVVRSATQLLVSKRTDDASLNTVIAQQFIIYQKAIKIIDKVAPSFTKADCVQFARNSSKARTTEINRPCLYIESMLGLPVYQVICDELLREPALRFKCELNQTQSSLSGLPNLSQPLAGLSRSNHVDPNSEISQNQRNNNLLSGNIQAKDSGIQPKPIEQSSVAVPAIVSSLIPNLQQEVVPSSNIAADVASAASFSSASPSPVINLPFSVIPTPVVHSVTDSTVLASLASERKAAAESPAADPVANDTNISPTTTVVLNNTVNVEPPQVETPEAAATTQVPPVSAPALTTTTAAPPASPTTASSTTSTTTATIAAAPTAAINSASPAAATPASVVAPNTGSVLAGSSSKESIFIKLNNRIKALELNMTLTLQALEELSNHHRDVVLQMSSRLASVEERLNLTIGQAYLNELVYRKKIEDLEQKLGDVTEKVELFMNENNSLQWQLIHLVHISLMIIEIMIIVAVVTFCIRKMKRMANTIQESVASVGPSVSISSERTYLASRVTPITSHRRAKPGGAVRDVKRSEVHPPPSPLKVSVLPKDEEASNHCDLRPTESVSSQQETEIAEETYSPKAVIVEAHSSSSLVEPDSTVGSKSADRLAVEGDEKSIDEVTGL